MKILLRKWTLMACILACVGQGLGADFMKGADLSMLQHLQDHGVEYRQDGKVRDPLLIFKEHGCNWIRLRLFVAPNGREGQVNTLSYTLRLAKRVKQAGLDFMLDLHYSDQWADPGHQTIPAEWKALSHAQLVERVGAYTRETVAAFHREGCPPGMVAVGNEITNGMLWPDAGPLTSEAKWDHLADLLKAAIRGMREGESGTTSKVMIHLDKGGNREACRWFFDNLQRRDVPFDVIGLSYYPFWHGTLADLKSNLAALGQTYKKDIIVVETAYDMSGGPQKDLPFPPTEAGQQAFLEELIRVVAATPDGRGKGVCYWAPEWISGSQWDGPKWSKQNENRALFDEQGNPRPALAALRVVE